MLKPLEDRVVVKRVAPEERTHGGLIIADTSKEKAAIGKVIAVGRGRLSLSTGERLPMSAKVGEYVMFGPYSGTEVKYEGEEYLIIGDGDIFGTVPPPKEV